MSKTQSLSNQMATVKLELSRKHSTDMTTLKTQVTSDKEGLQSQIDSMKKLLGTQFTFCAGNLETCNCPKGHKVKALVQADGGSLSLSEKTFDLPSVQCRKEVF